MAGVPPSESGRRPAGQDYAEPKSVVNPLSRFLNLGQEHGLTEDDQYSDNFERRRLFYIYDSATKIGKHLEIVDERYDQLPRNSRQALITGHAGNHIVAAYFTAVSMEMIPVYREPITALVTEIEDIMHEKGFRHPGSLYSPREHQAIGSSDGRGIYRETDPDVPLLRERLVKSGRMDLEIDPDRTFYTFEELDRARRLMGMTILDPETGRVTDQIDEEAVNDSYIYLSPERRAEVVVREAEILAEVEEIAKKAREEHEKSAGILPVLDAYSKGERTFVEVREVYDAILARLSERDNLSLDEPVKELRKIAFATGKWDHILTPQEILLRAGAEVDERYLARPYTPLAVQDGKSREEVERIRRGEASMVVTTALLEYEYPFSFRLEELDEGGNTAKSPTFLAREFAEEEMSDEAKNFYKDKMHSVSFARPGDWHYKEGNE